MSDDYWALAVLLAPDAADPVSNFLWEAGATGVVEEGDGDAVALRAFFPPGTHPAEVSRRLTGYLDALRGLSLSIGLGTVEITRVPAEAWADAWRAHFRPLPIGRRLLVCPPWEVPPSPPTGPNGSRIVILIEPCRAFGTGGHATTRGCLELLERTLDARPAERVLDIGTGSGILAIAAARLGAPVVLAVDTDPDAVAAAVGNAARNGVAARVRVEIGTLDAWVGPPADLVLANLLGAALVASAPSLGRCCRVAGRLIAGGLLVHEVPAAVASLVPEGFRLVELIEHEGWAALLLVRDG
ncbi:MAG: 50S ribosomal protein L11 methyltransferase [Candidatus Rokuibacteriota bacterium]